MKRLLLVRHAKSSWDFSLLNDFDRPLNKRGKHDAPYMGKRLALRKIRPQLMVTSPAKRAHKTALLMADELRYRAKDIQTDQAIYEARVWDLLRVVRKIPDRFDQVMVVGHNPGLTGFAVYISRLDTKNIPTCGVVCIDCAVDSWKKVARFKGTCVFFDYPKKK